MKNGEYTNLEYPPGVSMDENGKILILPAFPVRNISVVVMASVEYVPYLSVFLESLIDHAEDNYCYDIIVLHKNICEVEADNIKVISESRKNISIRFYKIQSIMIENFHIASPVYAAEAYYRLFTPWILPAYLRAIIMDVDIVLQSGLSCLFETELGECVAAGVKDILWQGMIAEDFANIRTYIKTGYPILDPYQYINTGVVLLNLEKMRQLYTMEQIVSIAATQKYRYQEQDILNLLLEGKIKYIAPEWNYYVPTNADVKRLISLAPSEYYRLYQDSAKNAKVLHFAATPKPWADPEIIFANRFWSYARRSMYYEVMLGRLVDIKVSLAIDRKAVDLRSGARKFADKVLPSGSRRREFAKYLLPRGSLRWQFCKQIYYIFRPQYRPQKVK